MSFSALRPFLLSAVVLALGSVAFAQTPQQQAATLIEKKNFFAAERIIEPLATAKKPDAESLYLLAQIRAAQHQTEVALKLVERAVKLDSKKPDYFAYQGQLLSTLAGERADVFVGARIRKAFESALKLDPQHKASLIGLTRFFAYSPSQVGGSPATAREYAAKLAALDPGQAEIELGSMSLRVGDFARALPRFQKAIELKPDSAEAYYFTGLCLVRLERPDEGRPYLDHALKLNPAYEDAKEAIRAIELAKTAKK